MDEPWWNDNHINASDLYGVAALSMPRLVQSSTLRAACNVFNTNAAAAATASCGPTCMAHVSCILSQIPPMANIWDPNATAYLNLASMLWSWLQLNRPAGMGRVATSKLISRKRPHVAPVLDATSMARMRLRNGGRRPSSYFLCFHAEVSALGSKLATPMAGVRAAAGVPAWVSDIRVIDIAIWFEHNVGC
jgi:hypothetical protein